MQQEHFVCHDFAAPDQQQLDELSYILFSDENFTLPLLNEYCAVIDDTQNNSSTPISPKVESASYDANIYCISNSPQSSPCTSPSNNVYFQEIFPSFDASVQMNSTENSSPILTLKSENSEEDTEDKEKPTKKRKKNQLQGNTAVSLGREQLLTISSQDLEAFAQTISSTRKLSSAEQRELRIQRRLVKNREYAQDSRKKKKTYVEELEGTITKIDTRERAT